MRSSARPTRSSQPPSSVARKSRSRLRQLLNVESGLNDGLALPIVVVLLGVTATGSLDALRLAGDFALGIALGIALPWIFIRLEQSRFLSASDLYEPLGLFAVGLGLLALCRVTGANEFLGAFVGGITVASVSTTARDAFHRFGELVTELLKLAALLAFGALVTPALLRGVGAEGWLFAVGVIVVARPVALDDRLASQHIGVARAGGGSVVRPEGVRIGGLRPDCAGGRRPDGGADIRSHRGRRRDLDRRPLLDRHSGGEMAHERDHVSLLVAHFQAVSG